MTYIWLGFIVLLLAGGAGAFFYGRKVGRDTTTAEVVTKAATVTKGQLQAKTDAPQGKEAVLKRIREQGL